jgi:opacity protein-like surface antigen
MLKRFAIVLLSTLLGTSLFAGNNSDTKGFIGFEVGGATVDGETATNYSHQGSAAEFGIRFGAQSDEWRATFTYDSFDSSDDDQNVEKGLLLVDYFLFTTDTKVAVTPFVGANVGMINYESTNVDATDFVYGGQAGVIVSVMQNLDLDLSYRYSLSGSERVNDLGSIMFGLNYLY